MRLKRTDRCALKLEEPGHYRRVPATGKVVVGHYLRCPQCGFKAIIILADENPGDSVGVDPETEELVGELTLEKPIECRRPGCGFRARVVRDEVIPC